MVSDENTKTLKSFEALDDAVNWLYLNGFKESARNLNDTHSNVQGNEQGNHCNAHKL